MLWYVSYLSRIVSQTQQEEQALTYNTRSCYPVSGGMGETFPFQERFAPVALRRDMYVETGFCPFPRTYPFPSIKGPVVSQGWSYKDALYNTALIVIRLDSIGMCRWREGSLEQWLNCRF